MMESEKMSLPIENNLGIRSDVFSAIKTASQKTGVSFDYLMDQAQAESSFQPEIQSKTSSATGLYQFINSTWMNMLEKHGSKYGINTEKTKDELLELRKNPQIASLMAAEFAKENANHLQNTVGGQIGETDLYLAHFLGAGGAEKFLKNWRDNPMQSANELFPQAAKANKNVFYNQKTGQARSLDDVYQFFAQKFDTENTFTPHNTDKYLVAKTDKTFSLANQITNSLSQNSLKKISKTPAPILSPYTNMILAALDVPHSNSKNETDLWHKNSFVNTDFYNLFL